MGLCMGLNLKIEVGLRVCRLAQVQALMRVCDISYMLLLGVHNS